MLTVKEIPPRIAQRMVVRHHYLHRKTNISHAIGLFCDDDLVGVCTFGCPPSRDLQKSACPSDPDLVIELNRLWVDDKMPRNTESWFISRALKLLPSMIVVSYADTQHGHLGFMYRACNFYYAGWTDMERKTPRYDYLTTDGKHSRDTFRNGNGAESVRVQRKTKHKYWLTTGNRRERKALMKLCGWPQLVWEKNQIVEPPRDITEPVRQQPDLPLFDQINHESEQCAE